MKEEDIEYYIIYRFDRADKVWVQYGKEYEPSEKYTADKIVATLLKYGLIVKIISF